MGKWILLITLVLRSFESALATNVGQVVHSCPHCEKKATKLVLRSYSNFGRATRDFSDSPHINFNNISICPWDLYPDWSYGWEKDPVPSEIKAFIESDKRAIELTAREYAVFKKHNKLINGQLQELEWNDHQ